MDKYPSIQYIMDNVDYVSSIKTSPPTFHIFLRKNRQKYCIQFSNYTKQPIEQDHNLEFRVLMLPFGFDIDFENWLKLVSI